MTTLRLVNCPVCGKPARFDSSNPFRPFCSERCKLIDLGQWANGHYRIPGPPASEPDVPDAGAAPEEP